MPTPDPSGRSGALHDPWFRQRPILTLGVIGVLFAAVLAWRLLSDSAEHYSVFYVLPVALAATAFGQRGGILSSLLACVLVVVGVLDRSNLDVTVTGWASRVVPLLLLGVLLGRATDRAREAEVARRHLELAALLHREAIEINDSLVQRMTAAKWAIEAGQTEAGLKALTLAVSEAQRLVSDLIRRAEMGDRTEHLPGVTDGRVAVGSEKDPGSEAPEAV